MITNVIKKKHKRRLNKGLKANEMKSKFINTIITGSLLLATTGCQEKVISMQSMRCEYVNAGEEAKSQLQKGPIR